MPMPTREMPTRETVLEGASQVDALMADTMSSAAPGGNYTAKALKRLAGATAKIAPLFNVEPWEAPNGDYDGPLPPELMKVLTTVQMALADYGEEQFLFELGSLTADDALVDAADKIEAAAGDRGFKTFLASTPNREEKPKEEAEAEPMEDLPGDTNNDDMSEEDMDKLIRERM